MWKVTITDLRMGLNHPCAYDDEVYFHHLENAKRWCEEDFRRDPWNEGIDPNATIQWRKMDADSITSGDLGTVAFQITRLHFEDRPQ